MRRPRRTHLQVEKLEGKALLSGVRAAPVASHVIAARQFSNMSNPLPSSDVQSLQQLASANNTVTFLTQLTMLESPRINADPNALKALDDARDLDLALHQVAQSNGTVVPADIEGTDVATARAAVSGINTRFFGQRDSAALLQAGNTLVSDLQHLATSKSPDLQVISQVFLPVASADVHNLELAMHGGTPVVGTPPSTTPNSTNLGASDLQTLEKSYSTTQMERFLAQFTALETRNNGLHQYAEKLIQDHEMEAIQIANYAQSTGTYLPANIQAQDAMTSERVLHFGNTRAYDRVYLRTMVHSHTKDIMDNRLTVATTTNPTLKQFAMDDLGTDWVHRAGAQFLLRRMR